MLTRGKWLFESDELGHPNSLFEDLAPIFTPKLFHLANPVGIGTVQQSPVVPDGVIRPPGVYLVQVPASSVRVE